jgi:chemotaxis signal transduction protein
MTGDRDVADLDRILRARARLLAVAADDSAEQEVETFASFTIAGRNLVVPIAQAIRAGEIRQLTEIPSAPSYLVGLVAFEGRLVSLLHLGSFLGLEGRGVRDLTAALVVGVGGREIGLAAEQLLGIEDVPLSAITQLPVAVGAVTRVCRQKSGRELLVVDVATLLEDPRLQPSEGRGHG